MGKSVDVCLVKVDGNGIQQRLDVVARMYLAIHGRELTPDEMDELRRYAEKSDSEKSQRPTPEPVVSRTKNTGVQDNWVEGDRA